MRSRRDDSMPQNLVEPRQDPIKEDDGAKSPQRQKSSTMRNLEGNTEEKQTTNFNRTISKASQSKMMTSQSQQNFLRAGKMKIKEQLQLKQELKDLEKDNSGMDFCELVINMRVELHVKIEEVTKDSIKWKR